MVTVDTGVFNAVEVKLIERDRQFCYHFLLERRVLSLSDRVEEQVEEKTRLIAILHNCLKYHMA